MHKYSKICNIYAIICINPTSMDLKLRENIQKYAKKPAIICKICIHEIYMRNLQKFALPTLLIMISAGAASP